MSIPTPPDLAVGRVSWTIGRGSSQALAAGRGVVRFKASAVAVNFSTATVLPDPVEAPVLAGVMTPVDLIQNDPEVWNWVVEPLLGVPWGPFPIDVDGPVDLATAAQTPGKGPVRAVKGETGHSLTGEVRYQDGEVEFGIEDGSWTAPVTMPPGPPGPGNTLQIGTVYTSTAGGNAEVSITGESPDQYLNLTLPRGDKPSTSWQGSTLVVDGVPGPDLRGPKGDASTEPGPPNVLRVGSVTTGAAGSQASASITGTSPEQTLGLTIPRGETGPRGPAGNVKVERPAPGVWDFQPEELDVQVTDVQGLTARLAALEYDSGQRNIAALFPAEVAVLQASIQRVGRTVTLAWGARFPAQPTSATIDLLTLPAGFRPPAPLLTLWEQPSAARSSGRVLINSSSGTITSYQSTQQGSWCYLSITYVTPDPIPTIPFGDPS